MSVLYCMQLIIQPLCGERSVSPRSLLVIIPSFSICAYDFYTLSSSLYKARFGHMNTVGFQNYHDLGTILLPSVLLLVLQDVCAK